jgi:hypothetical protein
MQPDQIVIKIIDLLEGDVTLKISCSPHLDNGVALFVGLDEKEVPTEDKFCC